jgi:hypothetical protein
MISDTRATTTGERGLNRGGWIVIALLVVAGAYFLLAHKDVPLNHVAVGLGNMHALHDVIGIILIGLAGVVWWRGRRAAVAIRP